MKVKTCKNCKAKFTTDRALQSCCDIKCAIAYATNLKAKRLIEKAKKERKEYKDAKLKLKSRSQWMREAQAIFNRWIRARDKELPCISCGCGNTKPNGQPTSWDAGHYRTTAAAPELRFEPKNVHKQCVHDNQHKHGSITEFRLGLLLRIGTESLQWLEGYHEPKKYTIDELKAIIAEYKLKLKALKC